MKKVFIDVDQVILSYEKRFAEFVNSKMEKLRLFNEKNLVWNSEHRFNANLNEKDFQAFEQEFVFSDELYSLPSMVDPEEFNCMSDRYETILVTNLPTSILYKRIVNLEVLGIRYSKLTVGGFHKYGEENYPLKSQVIAEEMGKGKEIYFLDDLPENCEDVADNIPSAKVFLMEHWLNRSGPHVGKYPCINAWQDFLNVLEITK